ncbi:secretin and TonB N-terminal domain-containing protein [Pseudoduganella violacea]|uniref:General secretion pathway protein D n=1 Tax=Pseudoduganella violacea TaxID=1715466 RepID=A0A7W5FWQ4_9BURK|nr:secretin and TonB N-terminal domain-containing protein [Pseudoduganella violacea]MBB3121523.1 general secretion pathway protein D [Pseudoduganella violacea]
MSATIPPILSRAALLASLLLAGCAAQTHHREGLQAMEQRNYASALDALGKASALQPDNVEYRKDWLRGRELATDRLLALAAAAQAESRFADAEQGYRAILDFDRDNARAQAGLEQLRKTQQAAQDAKEAREALDAGDHARAALLAGRALQGAPGLPAAREVQRALSVLQAKEALQMPNLGVMYRKPINLEFRDASLKFVFDALSRTTGINFIFDRDVKPEQRVTVSLKQTALDDAIDVLLSTSQLEKKILNSTSVLIYPNTPAKLREYQDLMVRAFYLANVEAKQAANMLKTVLKLKDVYVDDKYNLLILRESPETIVLAEKLISLQDLEEPEVMLEVEVLELNRSRLLNLGVQWPGQLTVAPLQVNPSTGTGTGTPGGTGSTPATMKISDLKSLNSNVLGITVPTAVLNAQKTDGDANLLANPRIRVRDREKAKILIGDKVPVVTTTSSANFVSENIQYLDVGLKLEVEPDIHLRDEVGLKLALEVSSLVSSVKTSSGSLAYQIGTRNFNSALRMKDGETQILAGLINDQDRSSANKVPLVGELPVLGRLFGSQSDSRNKTEIVLSITPHLIRNIQRKEPAAEAFWSGTEATLRHRPLQLRGVETQPATAASAAGAGMAPLAAAPDSVVSPPSAPNAPVLQWEGANQAKVGSAAALTLKIDAPELLRAVSLQLAYNPAELEILAVEDGEYFGKEGKATFSKAVDAAGGRISVSASTSGGGVKGGGRLLTLSYRPRAAATDSGISVISATPIGSQLAIGRPGLPQVHRLGIAP